MFKFYKNLALLHFIFANKVNFMILIADSGSTKTDWALIKPNTNTYTIYSTIGYNPYFIDSDAIYQSITSSLANEFVTDDVTEVHFYGAGCGSDTKKDIVKQALQMTFKNALVHVGHDLLASARALLGTNAGFAAILGTGTNSCLYDGKDCSVNIDSLGYLLGDEGSGCYIGKKLVRDFMRKRMDDDLYTSFKDQFAIESNDQIYQTLYHTQFPNRYLAGFCKFANEFASHPYIKNTVRDSFNDFFKNLVSKYPNYKNHSFNCVGSVGFAFKDILTEVAHSYDMKMGKVIQSPLNDLVAYHLTVIKD